jgi:hypothetical protein
MKIKDLAGQTFGRWTALRLSEERGKGTGGGRVKAMWICRCQCGTEKAINSSSLVTGNSQSCGCLKSERMTEYNTVRVVPTMQADEKFITEKYGSYMASAQKRHHDWQLTREEALALFKSDCAYCGKPPSNTFRRGNVAVPYNGIDRVNNDKGYMADNVVACCKICNKAKNNLTLSEFHTWIKRLVANYSFAAGEGA